MLVFSKSCLLWSLFITLGKESDSERECHACFINTILPRPSVVLSQQVHPQVAPPLAHRAKTKQEQQSTQQKTNFVAIGTFVPTPPG